jgi:hypothetical protein
MRLPVRLLLTIVAVLGFGARVGVAAEEFKPLVVGDDPKQFTLVAIGPETVTIRGGEVRVSGKPNGYFATKESYKNYVLRFEWMYERPEALKSDAAFKGNSGLLLHIKEHKVWPESIEVQLFNVDAGNTFGIPPAKFKGKKDAEAQKRAIKPVGEWNSVEVTCKDGAIVSVFNGIEIARGEGAQPDHGPIGFQSEGSAIRFRNLMIKPLD